MALTAKESMNKQRDCSTLHFTGMRGHLLAFIKKNSIAPPILKIENFTLRHGLRTPNEGVNQRYLKNWADVADKICFGRT